MDSKRRRLLMALALVFIVNILIIALAQRADAAVYRQGSTGDTVKQIQQKLSDGGYYSGEIDGIYGPGTAAAVRSFQKKNGLAEDGIVGSATLKALGMAQSQDAGQTDQSSTVALLARVISAEARGEPFSGQVAVGAVILNRVDHPSFPNTIAGVCYQPGAFTCMTDGQFNQSVSDSAVRAAKSALNGSDPSGGAIYYFNPATATSSWIWSRPLLTIIGKHRFCS